jgi:hypothetical protein
MDIVGIILILVAVLAMVVTGIWMLVCAFQKAWWWGLLYMFVPCASMIYIMVDWKKVAKPFLISVASLVVLGVGVAISPSMQKAFTQSQATH